MKTSDGTIGHKVWPLQLFGHQPGEGMAQATDENEPVFMVHDCESCYQRYIGNTPACCPQCVADLEELEAC